MGIIFAFVKNRKEKIRAIGRILDSLTLLIVISKSLAERILKEKGMSLTEVENLVVDCIKEGMKTIKE